MGDRSTRHDEEFDRFAVDAWPRLRRTAYLLTGDHHLAEDLAQTALARTYAGWRRVRRDDALAPEVGRAGRCRLAATAART